MKVAIAGGGKVGTYIAGDLAKSRHEVVLIERDANRAQELAAMEAIAVREADACELTDLHAAGLGDVDVMVAATGEDQVNLVVSLLAKQEFAIPRVVARVNHPKNQWLFNEAWGVDVSVSSPQLLTALVEEAVSVGSLVQLLPLRGSDARLVEVRLAKGFPCGSVPLGDIALPRDATIVAVVRDSHVIVPTDETVLEVADEVLALVTPDSEADLKALLVSP